MNRVHDLSGDWFAISPDVVDRKTIPVLEGDVLASTITEVRDGHDPRDGDPRTGRDVWADSPFVKVIEVLPIIGSIDERPGRGVPYVRQYSPGGPCFHLTPFESFDLGTLPGAQPGGWAVRVEPMPEGGPTVSPPCWVPSFDRKLFTLFTPSESGKPHRERFELPPSGRPLNDVGAA